MGFMTIFLVLTKPLMLAIGIDEQTAEYSLEYTLHMLPGIWLTGYFDAIRNFLIA